MSEKEALITLNAVPGIGNSFIKRLVEQFGSARAVLAARDNDEPMVAKRLMQNIACFDKQGFLDSELELINEQGIEVITYRDERYPQRLREIPDAPVVLYVRGNIDKAYSLCMSIVGSRKSSFYGLSMAGQFASKLSEVGFTIVSGLARGIDTAAHKGALKARGATIAVMGCGLSRVYPPENSALLKEIAATGAVISEFPMDVPPIAHNFPRRNRIISGLSTGVLVIEAAQKSGALITADFALEQGREVFALPGNIDNPFSFGVNNLIKQGAKVVTCVEDILEEIEPEISQYLAGQKPGEAQSRVRVCSDDLTEEEKYIYEQIDDQPTHIDELADRCKSGSSLTTSILLQLELKHLIKQLPGKRFVR